MLQHGFAGTCARSASVSDTWRAAVRANIDAMAKLMKDSSAAAENCKQIYNLADPEVQLALEARSGVLNDIIKAETWPQTFCGGKTISFSFAFDTLSPELLF